MTVEKEAATCHSWSLCGVTFNLQSKFYPFLHVSFVCVSLATTVLVSSRLHFSFSLQMSQCKSQSVCVCRCLPKQLLLLALYFIRNTFTTHVQSSHAACGQVACETLNIWTVHTCIWFECEKFKVKRKDLSAREEKEDLSWKGFSYSFFLSFYCTRELDRSLPGSGSLCALGPTNLGQ